MKYKEDRTFRRSVYCTTGSLRNERKRRRDEMYLASSLRTMRQGRKDEEEETEAETERDR